MVSADLSVPRLKLRPVLLMRRSKLATRVFAQGISHAFNEPRGLKTLPENAHLLNLKAVNHFVPDNEWLPAARAYDDAKSTN
jgi:hypothetical protein